MGNLLNKDMLRFFLGVSLLASCMMACDDKIELPDSSTVTLSGRVVDMLAQAANPDDPPSFVIEGATVALEDDARVSYVTGADGKWSLTIPNDGSDPFIKVTGAGIATSYFNIPVGTTGITQMDIPTVQQLMFILLFWSSGYFDFNNGCLLLGPTAGFTDANYPQTFDMIQGTILQVVPDDPPIWEGANVDIKPQYWAMQNGVPLPAPSLTETSNVGLWSIVVPDANTITSIGIYVVEELIPWDPTQYNPDPAETLKWKEGWLHAPNQQTRAGGFITSGTMNYLYESSCLPNDPCPGIANVDPDGVCYGTNGGDDYGCACLNGYEWAQATHTCELAP